MIRVAAIVLLFTACTPVDGPPIDANPKAVIAVTVTPGSLMLKRGLDATRQLTAMATLADGTSVDVTDRAMWSSSAASASVDRGNVKALLPGQVTITAGFSGVDGTANVTISSPEMFVLDYLSGKALNVFDAYNNGDTAPLRRIVGATTTLDFPVGVTVYKDEIYITDYNVAAIDVFPITANGDVAPSRRITGAATTLAYPLSIAIVNDEIYVTSYSKILVFPTSATGNVAPTRAITGSTTTMSGYIYGLQVDHGEIYVANYPTTILVFPANASGDVAPSRRIAGPSTLLPATYALRVANGEIFTGSAGAINVYLTTATGDVPPIRRLMGQDAVPTIAYGVTTLGEELYVTLASGAVRVFPRQATSDTPPMRTTAGATTTLVTAFSTAFY